MHLDLLKYTAAIACSLILIITTVEAASASVSSSLYYNTTSANTNTSTRTSAAAKFKSKSSNPKTNNNKPRSFRKLKNTGSKNGVTTKKGPAGGKKTSSNRAKKNDNDNANQKEESNPNAPNNENNVPVPCVNSPTFTFGSYTYNGTTVVNNCAWIYSNINQLAKRREKFCNEIYNGSVVNEKCPFSCNACPDSPSIRPSSRYDDDYFVAPTNESTGLKTSMPTAVPSTSSTLAPSISITTRPSLSIHLTNNPSSSPTLFPSNNSQKISEQPSVAQPHPQDSTLKPSISNSEEPTTASVEPEEPLSLLSSEIALALGHSQSAIIVQKELKLWGDNSHGQLGNGSPAKLLTPKKTTILHSHSVEENSNTITNTNIKQIAFGNFHACAAVNSVSEAIEIEIEIQSKEKLFCWGDNRYGQLGLGNGSVESSLEPQSIFLGTDDDGDNSVDVGIKQIALGSHHSCVVLQNDELKCFGYNRHGQIGDGDVLDVPAPKTILIGVGVKQVGLGDLHTCAILLNGELNCWGSNFAGQIGLAGDDAKVGSLIPRTVSFDEEIDVKLIALGGYHTCALLVDDSLWCWGFNGSGQLGDNSKVNSPIVSSL